MKTDCCIRLRNLMYMHMSAMRSYESSSGNIGHHALAKLELHGGHQLLQSMPTHGPMCFLQSMMVALTLCSILSEPRGSD
jgi:hypothetical protein